MTKLYLAAGAAALAITAPLAAGQERSRDKSERVERQSQRAERPARGSLGQRAAG